MITKDKNGNRVLTEVDLDNPIKTLVIGIVAKEDDPDVTNNPQVLGEVKRMRLNLIKLAVAGQGGDPSNLTVNNMYDTDVVQPYFADNAAELLESFRQALVTVNQSQVTQPGKGSLVETPPGEGEDLPSMFSTSYRIVEGNQWIGDLKKYIISDDERGFSKLIPDWELGERLLSRRGDNTEPANPRPVKFWNDGDFRLLSERLTTFADVTDINNRMNPGNLTPSTFGDVTPAEALSHWLQGYDFSYSRNTKYPRSSMLADFGNSGIIYADYPSIQASNGLPGYAEWAALLNTPGNSGKERLYAQTNDGILHVIAPTSGFEEAAILPPPTLLPSRLASLKSYAAGTDLFWQDVKGGEKTPGYRSYPSYTLDGPLQKRRFKLTDGWATLLLGTLGRGGNGLYMMDVTTPDEPKFLWYKENLGDFQISMGKTDDEPVSIATQAANPYRKLGFNSPKPAMGVAGLIDGAQTNFIALAGGSQTVYDPAQNGKEGATLLFIDPEDGSVLKAFDSNSLASRPRIGGAAEGKAPFMGMMVSEPTILRSRLNSYMSGMGFAADNRGNIFMISLEQETDGATTPLDKDNWSVSTVATLQPDSESAKNSDKSYAMPYGLAAYYKDNVLWLGGGTSNAMIKKSPSAPEGELKNDTQMIFGFRVNTNAAASPYVRNEFKELDDTLESKLERADDNPGWYFKLRSATQKDGEEYVTAKPLTVNGTLFVATFRENKIDTANAGNPCGITRSVAGEGRLYALDIKTGADNHWKNLEGNSAKYVAFEDTKIVELWQRSTKNGTFVDARSDTWNSDALNKAAENYRDTKTVNETVIETKVGCGGNLPMQPGTNIINYWIKN
jgi:hypothetical protein